jgi:hypothetical protein
VKYGLGLYVPEDDILHSHRRENLKCYIELTDWTLWWRRNVSPVKYGLGLYIPEDDIVHSHRRENLKGAGGEYPALQVPRHYSFPHSFW